MFLGACFTIFHSRYFFNQKIKAKHNIDISLRSIFGYLVSIDGVLIERDSHGVMQQYHENLSFLHQDFSFLSDRELICFLERVSQSENNFIFAKALLLNANTFHHDDDQNNEGDNLKCI